MKLHTVLAPLAFGLSIAAGLSVPARAQAPDPCTVFICMAGISGSGSDGGPGCIAPKQTFFGIQIWDPKYNPSATSAARRMYLMGCPSATTVNAGILNAIIAIWGESLAGP